MRKTALLILFIMILLSTKIDNVWAKGAADSSPFTSPTVVNSATRQSIHSNYTSNIDTCASCHTTSKTSKTGSKSSISGVNSRTSATTKTSASLLVTSVTSSCISCL